jgi:antitoxin component YwqK of YwqJK toxin-antitoxin module
MRYITIIFIFIIASSCVDKKQYARLDEIQVVRTSRDSSYLLNGLLYTGVIKKIINNSEQISFSVFEGKLQGKYFEYHPNGSQKIVCNYKNGDLNGQWSSYYDNDQLSEEVFYQEGLMQGKRTAYWRNGNIKEQNQFSRGAIVGVSEFYHSNGNLRKIISFDANGNRDGDWMDYHPNGKIKQKISYQSGKIIDSLVRYNLEGEIIINQ